MKFGRVSIDEATGAILAHSERGPARVFKKGLLLTDDEVEQLRAAGIDTVVVARLEDGDVHEDAAAESLATAACGEGIATNAAFTGRCNLYARSAGVLMLDPERVDSFNRVHESITLATLPPHTLVAERQMVATIKIIPFATRQEQLDAAAAIAAASGGLIGLAPLRRLKAALIQTTAAGSRATVLDKTASGVERRLQALGGTLEHEVRCTHDEDALAAAIAEVTARGADLLLITGASAIVDRRDVLPAGIVRAGGRIEHLGMPVDPGNLLLLAQLDEVPVLGLPGCARSPKLNGLDLVLSRLSAGLSVQARDIMRMGVGGLLKEMPGRPAPRVRRRERPANRAPKVAAVILAAGSSTRMGSDNKLLSEIDGRPMVARVAAAALDSHASPVIVVTGHQAEAVRAALSDPALQLTHNPDFHLGMSTSLAQGLRALPEDVDGVLVCLGDMPRIRPMILNRLIAAFDPEAGRAICIPTCGGKRGNPVLFDQQLIPELLEISGDIGARRLIKDYPELVCEVELGDDAVLIDVDTPEALSALLAQTIRSPA